MLVLDLVMKPGPAASWCIWAKQEPDTASETVESDWWRSVCCKTKKLDFWNSLFFCWISWLFFMSSFSLFIRLWLAKLQYRGRTWAGTGPKPPNQSAVNQSGYQVSMLTSEGISVTQHKSHSVDKCSSNWNSYIWHLYILNLSKCTRLHSTISGHRCPGDK